MNKEFETYYLAKTWKRITARIIDIIIVSLIPGIITLIWFLIDKSSVNNWKALLIMMLFNYLLFTLYFVIIPWKFNGQTLGKKMFAIKLVQENNDKISLKNILIREAILVFIPITLTMVAILLSSIFLQSNVAEIDDKTTSGFWISVLVRIIYSFIFAWYLGIMITTKVDKKHQLFYDRKFNLYAINKNPLLKKPSPQETKENPNLIHIHLGTKQPGNISQEELDEIKNL
ncbi:RDD family protein [Spiroplasma platyhelix]|uniref:RDD family protein n=1 Tax=Spiroplasma platyhelix PALS-1 TaxID=1276218 RepID=A0A846U8I2_9MOLU|nr:RDD family protein [Spiroplasma platyhelix]MBE4703820.1 hypothetical protein [Spiroplasma platyhelix PALS-1]NKE38193.1 RDD family protein [Spiroplasma platyhelix PALS-1]UJB29078.1 hypothetical protein SPLAT_v1c03140 [Spiroplasma platyhelix PALS-1]